MAKLVSSWCNVLPVPDSYIFPPETRPGELPVSIDESTPVIDLTEAYLDRNATIQKILKAAEEFGYFQVINHGVSETLMDNTRSVFKQFFEMPVEDKEKIYSEDTKKECRLCTSSVCIDSQTVYLWRDNLKHPCYPVEQWKHIWPEKPIAYREEVGACSNEIKKLASRILELISEGLGLKSGFFNDELNGLQVLKDEKWVGVPSIPKGLTVNIGLQLQVISNGKLRAPEHRVATNSSDARTSAAFFIQPSFESIIEPAETLIDAVHPALYKSFTYKEFLSNFIANHGEIQESISKPLEF